MRKPIKENIRLRIAYKLDSNPTYCWDNLVMWAFGYYSTIKMFFGKRRMVNKQLCEKNNEYCGKCKGIQ